MINDLYSANARKRYMSIVKPESKLQSVLSNLITWIYTLVHGHK